MKINDYSQAGQTTFVSAFYPKRGVYLDVGAAGLSISNTLGLEDAGWFGVLVDNSSDAATASKIRKAIFQHTDATHLNYTFLPTIVDYGSFDIDGATLDAMRRVFETSPETRFGVLTVEHDFYARGELLRTPMLELLRSKGYDILCADVCHEGQSFEIWCVHPELVDMTVADKFRRDKPTDWREILNVD